MWGIIATWRMSLEGLDQASKLLSENKHAGEAVCEAIKMVEDNEYYKSVGYGGLPNEEMVVELDAAYMDGTTLDLGAVASIKDFANPVLIAKRLSKEKVNSLLVGEGAEKFATKEGFERKNMLSERAKIHYHNKIIELKDTPLRPYDGHDTVGMVSLDTSGNVVSATSTSGLFMKKAGRVGDSPIAGSGFYADSFAGGATATGLGEDLMKGCISYEITRLMKDGLHPQVACDKAVNELNDKLIKARKEAGDISVVAMDNQGRWGVSSNIKDFSFVVATSETPLCVYITNMVEGKSVITKATNEWLENYMKTRTAPLIKK